ncbi:MAG: TetR/AcrR family transcriptional regulator [Sporichthyaceae bacterium]
MTGPLREGQVRTPRQQELLVAAARLFARDGYHAVGINDISAEVGLSGPALYRHYPSKEALLIAVFDDAITTHLEEVVELARSIRDPLDALDAIVANHIDFVFDQTDAIVTWRMEYRSLPEGDRHRLRYLQRLYTEEWVRAVAALRPECKIDQIRVMCQGAIAMIQSATEFQSRLPREVVGPTLAAMALHSLVGTPAAALPAVETATSPNGSKPSG